MRIIYSDLKKGKVELRVESNDDVWHLKSIVEPNDTIIARTWRHVFIHREGRREKAGKRYVTLTLKVKRVSYHPTTNRLRITGRIINGPEDVRLGSYHSIDVGVGSVLTVVKDSWKRDQVERLKLASKLPSPLLIVCVELDKALFAELRGNRVRVVSEMRNPYSLHEGRQTEFYKTVSEEIRRLAPKAHKIVLGGPGFAKDNVLRFIKGELKDRVVRVGCSSADLSGINEMLKSGVLDELLEESRVVEEVKLVGDLFKHIGKDDGLACYGYEEVRAANEVGAVSVLLVSEERIKEKCVEELARSVEKMGGRVEIISKDHEMGERFHRIGGIGAILRFKYRF